MKRDRGSLTRPGEAMHSHAMLKRTRGPLHVIFFYFSWTAANQQSNLHSEHLARIGHNVLRGVWADLACEKLAKAIATWKGIGREAGCGALEKDMLKEQSDGRYQKGRLTSFEGIQQISSCRWYQIPRSGELYQDKAATASVILSLLGTSQRLGSCGLNWRTIWHTSRGL